MLDRLKIGRVTWVHVSGFDTKAIEQISREFDLHELIVDDIHELNTQDKIDVIDNHISMVVHFPKYEKTSGNYLSNEFNIVLGKDFILTVTRFDSNHVLQIRSNYKKEIEEADSDEQYKITPYYILYKILDVMYDKAHRLLQNVSKDVYDIQESLVMSQKITVSLLEQLIHKKRNLVYLKHTFEAQGEIFEEIGDVLPKVYEDDLDVYFEDIFTRNTKIIRNISMIYENLLSLIDAYNTLMNLRTSNTIFILTIFTALMLPLTFVTGVFGMNVSLPLQADPYGFWVILGIMFVVMAGMMLFFRFSKII